MYGTCAHKSWLCDSLQDLSAGEVVRTSPCNFLTVERQFKDKVNKEAGKGRRGVLYALLRATKNVQYKIILNRPKKTSQGKLVMIRANKEEPQRSCTPFES